MYFSLENNKNDFFDLILKHSPYPFVVYDLSLEIITVSRSLEDVLKSNQEELIHKKIYELFPVLFPKPDHVFTPHINIIEHRNSTIFLRPSLVQGKIADTDVNLIFFEDITERVKAEEQLEIVFADLHQSKYELENTLSALQRSNDELQQFAYVASHDLKEPLRTISSYLQLIERRYKHQLDKDADEFIAFTVDAADRMDKLINNLLLYSRVHTRTNEFEYFDCNDLMIDVLSRLVVLLEEKKAEVIYDELPTIYADKNQIALLLQNLITNGIKFQEPGTLPVVRIFSEERDEEFIIGIEDNGIGIEEKYFHRIFDIFQRLHTSTVYPGSGMGLSIAKRVVQRHKGRLWVNSEPGKGSTFYFSIPKLSNDDTISPEIK